MIFNSSNRSLKCSLIGFGIALCSLSLSPLPALYAGEQMVAPKEIAISQAEAMHYDWSLEVGSGVQWSNVRMSHGDGYTILPANITAALKIDEVSLDTFAEGILRGNTEFLFQSYGYAITHGPTGESRIVGLNFGPRYNFVQPGWKVVPYVEGLVGFGFADSAPMVDAGGQPHGLGQDFNFTFGVGAGVRYDLNKDWFVRLGANYTHFSNAGLSEPQHSNQPIDALGPQLSVGIRF